MSRKIFADLLTILCVSFRYGDPGICVVGWIAEEKRDLRGGAASGYFEPCAISPVRSRMIKRTINPTLPATARHEPDWIRLDEAAEIEITSEADGHPVEAALVPGDDRGWLAASPGPQTIRVLFNEPRPVRQVRVVIEESTRERTQQFVLRAAASLGGAWRELTRQQFNFSPGGASREEEDYVLNLPAVAALELTIVPDISGGDARACLQQFRVA